MLLALSIEMSRRSCSPLLGRDRAFPLSVSLSPSRNIVVIAVLTDEFVHTGTGASNLSEALDVSFLHLRRSFSLSLSLCKS